MGRTKKEAPKAEAVEEVAAPVAAEGEEAKKGAGRGKRKVKEASAEGSPPKRTLRSNSKTSLFDAPAPVEKKAPVEEKKPKKAPAKVAKATEDEEANTVENGTNGTAEPEAEPKVAEKAGKKGKKTAPTKTDSIKETEEEEPSSTTNGQEDTKPEADAEKPTATVKPVKAVNGTGKGKKKDAKPVEEAKVEASVPDEPATAEEDTKEKAAAGGKGKKKADKPKEDEVAAAKKTKKEPAAKPAKATKTAEPTEEKETKTAASEPKKAAKGKGAKAKEVAVEHWHAERVKNILSPFCEPTTTFTFNPTGPRRGAFEIVVTFDNDEEQVLWSGLKKGPPRKEKFPSDEQLTTLAEALFVKTE